MASKMRSLDTRFWSDVWVRQLNALDRYVFIYFLTNQHSTWCGVYEVDIGMIAFETGIDEHDLKKSILPRLSPKIIYIDGWVYIKNFEKYHGNKSPLTKKGIETAWEAVPDKIINKIKEITKEDIPYVRGIGGVSSSASSSSFASSYTSTPSLKEREDTPSLIARDFFSQGKYWDTYVELFSVGNDRDAVIEEFKKFSFYWTEKNKSGTKERWEQQNTFEVKRRLITWFSRIKSFNKEKSGGKIIRFTT